MNGWKKKAHYILRQVRHVKIWQMSVVLVAILIVLAICLRVNNQNMTYLRQDLITADQGNDSVNVKQAAEKLKNYVSHHMNTDTGLVPLQNSYNRAVQTAFQAVNARVDSDGYNVATESCKSMIAAGGYQAYAACVANAVGQGSVDFATPDLPNPALYYISYASPLISADLAGFVAIVAIVVFLAIILRVLSEIIPLVVLHIRNKKH